MKNVVAIPVLENIWRNTCEWNDEKDMERSAVWRLLKCRYRLLLIKKEVTIDQIKDFDHLVADFKRLTEQETQGTLV